MIKRPQRANVSHTPCATARENQAEISMLRVRFCKLSQRVLLNEPKID